MIYDLCKESFVIELLPEGSSDIYGFLNVGNIVVYAHNLLAEGILNSDGRVIPQNMRENIVKP